MEKNLSRTEWREAATGGLYAGLAYALLTIAAHASRSMPGLVTILNAVSFFSFAGFLYFYARRMAAYAGGDGRDHHFIAALEMTPQKLKIGDFKYKTKESRLWAGRLRKGQPQMACVRNGEIQMQSITKELLNELPV